MQQNLLIDEQKKAMSQGTAWLLEMEALNNPHMKNALILNIYKISHHINDVEILIDTNQKKMLIYLGISGFAKIFRKAPAISKATLDMMGEALPSFSFRVIFDVELFLKGVRGFKASLASPKAEKKAPVEPKIDPVPESEPKTTPSE